ncbi:hypothetical protein [Feifania hominis]|uniref:Uncharacterized protein n=1 Tax=Feifania hominis TaxID=2763660 RepID=A0A926DDB7_9FIRM|nr:hypothetical protein [Feifania hominis]MBC8535762.1 hypothetical protein [Feifania hominis]
MHQYPTLHALLRANPQAKKFYDSFPDYVKEQMENRADSINSFESMCHYADNLTRGDC